jgi:hypothetical protein
MLRGRELVEPLEEGRVLALALDDLADQRAAATTAATGFARARDLAAAASTVANGVANGVVVHGFAMADDHGERGSFECDPVSLGKLKSIVNFS